MFISSESACQAAQILFHDKPSGEPARPTLARHSALINMHAGLSAPMMMLPWAEIAEWHWNLFHVSLRNGFRIA